MKSFVENIKSKRDFFSLLLYSSIVIYFVYSVFTIYEKVWYGASVNLIALFINIFLLIFYRKRKIKTKVTRNAILILSYSVVTIQTILTGGIYSPWIFWLTILPIISSFFYKKKGIVIATYLLVISTVFILLFLELFGVKFEVYGKGSLLFWISTCLIGLFTTSFGYHLIFNKFRKLDLDKLKKKNLKLDKIQKKLIDAQKGKDIFFATMSHEIRTPMNAIVGVSKLLDSSSEKNEEMIELHQILKFSSKHLLSIVNDVLDVSKIQDGKINIQNVEFNLKELVHTVNGIFRFQAEEKDIDQIDEICGKIPEILLGDPNRLTQILVNLLNNAMKFTSKGYVKIRCSIDESIQLQTDKIFIKFEVIDTGIGISNEDAKKLFVDFQQANDVIASKYGGTGLGLSISKMLASILGGEIKCESILNKGSNFYFTLPFEVINNENYLYNHYESKSESLKQIGGLQILIVDDNKINQIIAKKILKLEFEDCNFKMANNGLEALENMEKYDFDIVLMDIKMPIMDGFEATEKIRNLVEIHKRNTPIIAMTASVGENDRLKALQCGVNNIIHKPFDVELLKSMIIELIKTDYIEY